MKGMKSYRDEKIMFMFLNALVQYVLLENPFFSPF